jgi:hypothetical protein
MLEVSNCEFVDEEMLEATCFVVLLACELEI